VPGCGANHVQDLLFRLGTLRAGLRILRGESGDQIRFLPPRDELSKPPDPKASRRELVRRFLRLRSRHTRHARRLAGADPAAGRRIWHTADDELVAVEVEGKRAWAYADDLEALRSAPQTDAIRLLPPYDPITELADRDLLVPDAAGRRRTPRGLAGNRQSRRATRARRDPGHPAPGT